MNSRDIEALLGWIKETAEFPYGNEAAHEKITAAIRHLRNRRQAQAKRKAHFKLRADEQRELLR